jgi:hypothetical protein
VLTFEDGQMAKEVFHFVWGKAMDRPMPWLKDEKNKEEASRWTEVSPYVAKIDVLFKLPATPGVRNARPRVLRRYCGYQRSGPSSRRHGESGAEEPPLSSVGAEGNPR